MNTSGELILRRFEAVPGGSREGQGKGWKVQGPHKGLLGLISLIRPFKGLIRPFKGLMRHFKGLIRPLKGPCKAL